MTTMPLRYWVDVAGRSFLVREVDGSESLSRPFRFELSFKLVDGPPIEPRAVLREKATIRLVRGGDVRAIDGIVTRASTSAVYEGVPETKLVIEPRLSLARFRQDIRVFREKTAPEIILEVLDGLQIKTEVRLAGSYERRPYCVQFRETDLDFVHRMMEDEGIFYYFLPGDLMVIADGSAAYEPLPGVHDVPFRGGFGMDMNEDAIFAVGRRASLAPSKVSLRDFNPDRPSLDMDVSAEVPSPSGTEWYDYPGEYLDPAHGERKARIAAEAIACASNTLAGKSYVGRLFPGCELAVTGAPVGFPDGSYVITALTHKWDLEVSGFDNEFRALPGDVTFRPPRVTHVPEIRNPMTGYVTCPPGDDDIYTDEFGRVKVHFHWDRIQPQDGECSHWIPVLQDNTGNSCAMPRRGWEVIVHFLEGDPDRPVVVGRVYNGEDLFPEFPPREKTKSSLKSHSTPSRDGTNEIRFEDLKGSEHLWVHAQKDMNVVVANDKLETIKSTEAGSIERDETINIGSNHTLKIGSEGNDKVVNDQKWTVSGDRKREVRGDASSSVAKDRSVTIDGSHNRTVGSTDQVNAENLTETVSAMNLEISQKGNSTQGEKGGSLDVGGAIIEIAASDKNETAALSREEIVGGMFFTKAGEEIGIRASEARRTEARLMRVTAVEDMTFTAVDEMAVKAGSIEITDRTSATFKVADTTIVMANGVMTISAPSEITLKVSSTNKQGAKTSTQI